MPDPNPAPSPRECAELLLRTVPGLMRALAGGPREHRPAGEESPSLGQLRLLSMLDADPCSLRQLAGHHRVTPSTMSRSVEVLVQRGWVAREPDSRDRRQLRLTLTGEGRVALAAMAQTVRDALGRLLDQLDATERTHLFAGLSALGEVLDIPHVCAHGGREAASGSAITPSERGTR